MINVLIAILGFIVACVVVVKIFFWKEGNPKVVVCAKERTPFKLDAITEKSISFSSKVEFRNVGTQCATIMDCIVRTLLPYEQYDGVKAEARAELEGAPREDDYFESVLIQKKESIFIYAKVTLTARKGMDIRTALTHMVDLPMDIVYTELGRRPWTIRKMRIVLTADEIAKLAGIKLAEN